LIADHRELVQAYRRGSLTEIKEIMVRHNELGKATQRAGTEHGTCQPE
jgi:hypothetical protein